MNKFESFIIFIRKKDLGNVSTNECLKNHCSLKIGGLCLCMYYPNSVDNLIKAFDYIVHNELPYYIIGNGTNILFSDKFHKCIIINTKKLTKTKITSHTLYTECGTSLNVLSRMVSRLGYTNLERFAGIPGTVGGAIYMNAGSWNKEMKDILEEVTYIDEDGNLKTITNFSTFSYRKSYFTNKKCIILYALIKIKTAVSNISPIETYHKYLSQKKNKEPQHILNAGCTFKNPPHTFAYKLIEESCLKEFNINDAAISSVHSNVLINKGNASYEDMMRLINIIKENVYEKYNIELELEWCLVN